MHLIFLIIACWTLEHLGMEFNEGQDMIAMSLLLYAIAMDLSSIIRK